MTTKSTKQKSETPTAKKTSSKLALVHSLHTTDKSTNKTSYTTTVGQASNSNTPGTVAWLIEELHRLPGDEFILMSDHDGYSYNMASITKSHIDDEGFMRESKDIFQPCVSKKAYFVIQAQE